MTYFFMKNGRYDGLYHVANGGDPLRNLLDGTSPSPLS